MFTTRCPQDNLVNIPVNLNYQNRPAYSNLLVKNPLDDSMILAQRDEAPAHKSSDYVWVEHNPRDDSMLQAVQELALVSLANTVVEEVAVARAA